MDTYPVNAIGSRFGFTVRPGWISDPGAPAGTLDAPALPLRSLEEYQPLRLRVLRSGEDDVAAVASLAAADPRCLFVIEGERMGLALAASSGPH
jgi:hypothetical protein